MSEPWNDPSRADGGGGFPAASGLPADATAPAAVPSAADATVPLEPAPPAEPLAETSNPTNWVPGSAVEVHSPDGDGDPPGGEQRPAPFVSKRSQGFADPGLLAGRSRWVWVYIGALILAAAADVANFNQIVQYVMRDQRDLIGLSADALLLVTVAGFTACVLFLAHVAGVMLRDRRAGETWVPAVLPWLCLLIWAGLGACGLYVRLDTDTTAPDLKPAVITGQPTASLTPVPSATVTAGLSPRPEAAEAGTYNQFGAAAIFLGLYLGTGLVAIVGGYLTHNPAHATLVRARRRDDAAVRTAAESSREYALARGEVERLEQLARHALLITRADRTELLYQGELLKMEARLRAAQQSQDPAFTDAWVPPPTRPGPRV